MFFDIGPENIHHGTGQFNYAVYRHDLHYGYAFPGHWHEEYEIIYVKEGIFRFLVNGELFCVHKDQALFLDQCAIHAFPENDSRGCYISILFGKKFLFPASSSYICQQFYSEIPSQRVSLTQKLTEETGWQRDILSQIRRLDRLSCTTSESALTIQIALLTIMDTLRSEKSYSPIQNHPLVQNESIREALLYIHQNYDEKISVQDIAWALHLSVNHFIRIFKFMLGTTPQKYIQTYRVQQAISIMSTVPENSFLSIAEIAAAVGFNDVNYFSRSFKKVTGMTPSQYINDNIRGKKHNNCQKSAFESLTPIAQKHRA